MAHLNCECPTTYGYYPQAHTLISAERTNASGGGSPARVAPTHICQSHYPAMLALRRTLTQATRVTSCCTSVLISARK